ncbi:MAG TPA: methyl-accepting chemotaxis protein [Deferrimonas sp.]|jgi:methyl-accepting chemotaxis protein
MNSISAKFIVALLLVLLAGQGLGAFLFLRHSRSELSTALHERMQRLARQSAGVVAEPVLNYNFALIDGYLTEALQDRDIVAMRVLDPEGEIISEKVAEASGDGIFSAEQLVKVEDAVLGRIRIDYTTHTIDDWLASNLVVIPLYQLAMLAGVAAVLILMIGITIKRPVTRINRLLGQVTAGDLTVQFPLFARDDIGSIADGVRFLMERLASTIARIHSISANASATLQGLNQTFGKVTGMADDQRRSVDEVARAVRSASDSQERIVAGTEELRTLSGDNGSALLEMRATSEEVAGNTEKLGANVNNSYSALTQLTESARQVSTMAGEVSQAVETSSASVEEIFSSVKEVEGIVRASTRRSEETTALLSDRGMVALSEAAQSMQRIESFMTTLTGSIHGMEERSGHIGKILGVIGEVTDQLQLLSLNAQIIAAQAGQNGQGFAVVADEMRELSSRTALSTQEIEGIVSGIQGEIGEVVKGARDVVQVIKVSREVVDRTGGIFRETLDSSQQATEMSRKIERAAAEQSRGLELVVSATEQIKSRIQEVSQAVSEQEKSTAFLLENLGSIKELMSMVQGATREQARSTRLISDNIELANCKTSDISEASQQQQQVNGQILTATELLVRLATETTEQIEGNSSHFTALEEEIALLQSELKQFRTAPV